MIEIITRPSVFEEQIISITYKGKYDSGLLIYKPNNGNRFLTMSYCNCSAPPLLKRLTKTTSSKRNCREEEKYLEIVLKKNMKMAIHFALHLLDRIEQLNSSKLD